MMPNKDYKFNGNKVTEYPIASNWNKILNRL
jgi:hypothetical protein